MRKLPFLLLAFSLAAFAEEQPYLVRDLPGYTVHDSMPYMPYGRALWATIGNVTWFMASTGSKSMEVFKSDGTTGGTVQVTHATAFLRTVFSVRSSASRTEGLSTAGSMPGVRASSRLTRMAATRFSSAVPCCGISRTESFAERRSFLRPDER